METQTEDHQNVFRVDKGEFGRILTRTENKDLGEFTRLFYERLLHYNMVTANTHRYSAPPNELYRFHRRLDAMASLLVGNETCAAVCIADNELLVATNKSEHTMETYIDPLWTRMFTLWQHLSPLAKMAYTSKAPITYYEWSAGTRKAFVMEALTPKLMEFISKNSPGNLLQKKGWLKKFVEKLIDSFNHYLETIKKIHFDVVSDWMETHKGQAALNNQNLFSLAKDDYFLDEAVEFLQHLLKVEEAFTNLHENESFIKNISERKLKLVIVDDGEEDVHAEMRIIEYLLKRGGKTDYIGITRLCCAHCNLCMSTFGMEQVIDEEQYDDHLRRLFRGHHGNPYQWRLSQFFLNNHAFLQVFLGGELYHKYLTLAQGKDVVMPGCTLKRQEFCMVIIEDLFLLSAAQLRNKNIGITNKLQKELPEKYDPSIDFSQTSTTVQFVKGIYLPNKGEGEVITENDPRYSEINNRLGRGNELGYIRYVGWYVRIPVSGMYVQSDEDDLDLFSACTAGEEDIHGPQGEMSDSNEEIDAIQLSIMNNRLDDFVKLMKSRALDEDERADFDLLKKKFVQLINSYQHSTTSAQKSDLSSTYHELITNKGLTKQLNTEEATWQTTPQEDSKGSSTDSLQNYDDKIHDDESDIIEYEENGRGSDEGNTFTQPSPSDLINS